MIFIISIATLLQGCIAVPIATENCPQPLEIVNEFDILQEWVGGASIKFNFHTVGNVGDSWAALIKFNGPILMPGVSVRSWLHTDEKINADGSEILLINVASMGVTYDTFSLFVTFNGLETNDFYGVIDKAMVFDVKEGICFDKEYEENFQNEKDLSLMRFESSGEEEEEEGVQEDEVEEDNCVYVHDAATMEAHMWRREDHFNFKGNIQLEEKLSDWTVKLFLSAPVTEMETWIVDSAKGGKRAGNLWYFTPKDYNTETSGIKINFIAEVAEESIPTALVFLCNYGEQPSPSLTIPSEAEENPELMQSLVEMIANSPAETGELVSDETNDNEQINKTELMQLFN